ncbi:hypothetical protein GMORB2_6442 [Geosmithia morbida]|uniref:RNA polymerase I-specific transcription initiation factor RRN6-like protein n=1 Tax=Geosmithia morbida TaxID=1094350 RepID=A0A9P4YV94_9HYPO|nr:uncharacterized protein GMORB2_6442 [Geosmithia morbida]KAF4123741.1 hypothetical protein GMORB2_6442 [Geosmithia morbida]
MADARQFADLRFGHVGRLTYLPRDDRTTGQPGSLHTTRLTSNQPCFKQVGSSTELFPASRSELPEPTHSHLWAERNLQTRWLLKSHPEAFMGNPELATLLREDDERFRRLDGASSTRSVLAMGEMLDSSTAYRPTVAPVLATATGESGELLRLVRVEDTRWGWGDSTGTTLHLSVIDPVDHEDEVLWASDGLPISQVKFAASLSIRWLLVQKQTSTTILYPEYNKVPRSESRSYRNSRQALSRINPTPLLALSHRNTGGNAHSDVAFNPPGDDRSPQLCIVDECGYWTLWNVLAYSRTDRKKLRLSLSKCGHIWEGALAAIPSRPLYPAEKHGVLFAGKSGAEDFWDDDTFFHDSGERREAPRRSTHLVLWNSEQFEVVDIESNSPLPRIANFSTAKSKFGHIIDIRLSPIDQRHIFMLTTQFIVWIDVTASSRPGSSPQPAIILTCPHRMENSAGLRMSVSSSTGVEGEVPMVFVSSTTDHQVSVHWFNLDPRNKLAQWHSQIAYIMQCSAKEESKSFALQEISFHPCKFTSTHPASGTGFRYRQAGVQFYQGMVLGQDLSLRYCVCFAASDPRLDVTPPTNRIGWTKMDQNRRWKKKRLQMLRYMGETVVVPETMTDDVIMSLSRRPPQGVEDEDSSYPGIATRGGATESSKPVHLNMSIIRRAISERLHDNSSLPTAAGLPQQYLDMLRDVVHGRHINETMPFMTWQDIVAEGESDHASDTVPAEQLAKAVEEMLREVGDQTVMVQLTRRRNGDTSRVGNFSQLHRQLKSIWLGPLRHKLSAQELAARESWLADLSRELFLSMHGVAVQGTMNRPLFNSNSTRGQSRSQQSGLPPRNSARSSQAATSGPPSSPFPSSPPASSVRSSAEPISDDAFERLRLLAPTIQPPKTSKKPAVLSYWPTERGVDPATYVSSVAIASDKKLDGARQRLQRIEAKRRATSDRYRRRVPPPPLTSSSSLARSGLPSPLPEKRDDDRSGVATQQVLSSQLQMPPSSSQVPGPPVISMSQPVSGPFGGRKKKKAKKEKRSGFR